MIQDPNIAQLLEDAYQKIPGLDCSGCHGDCCVSPTMTAPEFARIMQWAHVNYGEAQLAAILQAPSREHLQYADNAFCRFQADNGLCTNYQGRALACRLHGHEAMRAFASSGTEFCHRSPSGNHVMNSKEVEPLIENIRKAIALSGISYVAPYFLLSLNLECWIDFAYHPEWSAKRPSLQPTRDFLAKNVVLPILNPIPQHTTLAGKLNTIDRYFSAIEKENIELVGKYLQELLNDFPSCASYYFEEASSMDQLFRNA